MAIAPELAGAMSILSSRRGGELFVEVRGDLDAATAPLLLTRVELEAELCPQRLVLDLSGVSFCGSAGIGALLRIRKRADECGVELVLARPSQSVMRVLGISGLERYFSVEA
ncbi:MAG: anti-anti-sigma factor [Acidimicrobiales bacterium]|nr:MAG: anti-anti-sigma factor [Acidimicrobiales bacterium]